MQAVKEKKQDRRTYRSIEEKRAQTAAGRAANTYRVTSETTPQAFKDAGAANIRKASRDRAKLKSNIIQEKILVSAQQPAYTDARLIAYRLAAYFYRQDSKPVDDSGHTAGYTETGLIVALGIDHTVFKAYAAGDRDYLDSTIESREGYKAVDRYIADYKCNAELTPYYLYLIGVDPHCTDQELIQDAENKLLLSHPLQKARLLISEQREQRLADRGRVGDIFTLKARENWSDNGTNTTSITIRRDDDIDTALKMLGFKQD